MEPTRTTSLDRRAVLRGAATVAAATALPAGTAVAATGAGPSGASRPRPAARRPSPADWKALQRDIDGTVVERGDRGYPRAHRLFNPRFDDLHPLAVVRCASTADVRTTIDFARKQGLKSRAKAGGHSYVGASSLRGGVVIDVGEINQVRYDAASGIATIGAGRQLYPAHRALAAHGRTIPTGTCPTVGAAGLTLGGGLGVASREFGLTCDQLAEVRIVLASGEARTVSRRRHADLFWACQGGGGGSFGVVTALRFHTQRARRMGFFIVTFPWGSAAKVVRGWSHRVSHMPRTAWANLHLDAASGAATVHVVGVCRAGDQEHEAQALERAVGVSASDVSTFERSYLGGVEYLGGGTTSARQNFAAGSDVVSAMTPALARTLVQLIHRRAAGGRTASAILDPLTGAVRDVGRGATAFPWRNHLCDIQWYLDLPNGAPRRQVAEAYDWVRHAHRQVGRHSDGGYVNYLEPGRPLREYFAANYGRLRRVKARVDPDDFFHSPYSITPA